MPVFTYRGTNKTGATVPGERTAGTKAEVKATLRAGADQRQQALGKGQGIQYPYLRRRAWTPRSWPSSRASSR